MSWGDTIQIKVRVPGFRFSNDSEIRKALKDASNKINDIWRTIRIMAISNPFEISGADTTNSDKLEKVMDKFSDLKANLMRLYRKQNLLFLLVGDGTVEKKSELSYYGGGYLSRFFNDIDVSLNGGEANYGTERTLQIYMTRETFSHEGEIHSNMERNMNFVESFFCSIENLVVSNPSSYISSTNEPTECDITASTFEGVIFNIRNEIESLQESIEDDFYKAIIYELSLQDWEFSTEPIRKLNAAYEQEEEWNKQKDKVFDEILEKHGLTKDELLKSGNLEKIKELDDEYDKLLEERGLKNSPVDWDKL